MLRLIQSNHMPVLAQLFCEQSQRQADPFEPTTVIVQSFGIGQWLKLQLAEHQGISANLDCLLPANYIWRLFRELLPDQELPEESPFDRSRLAWRLMRLLPDLPVESIQRYLAEPGDEDIRRYQLSYQIAQLYDQYLVYRPSWPLAWQAGNPLLDRETLANNDWQPILWQSVIADQPGLAMQHRAGLHQLLLERIRQPGALPNSGALSIFGLSSLAPMQLETFRALAEVSDVDVYFLNPCRHYWGDIVRPQDKARRSIRALVGSDETLDDSDYLTVGNPLLGGLGKQGREYLELFLDPGDTVTHELFLEPGTDTMLSQIKQDILDLEYGGCFDVQPTPGLCADNDYSVQIHSAHSRMREVEILFDQILAIIDRNPDISPKDIIVMAPDISGYAPFINAVFRDQIHFGIADRTLIQQSTLIASFFKLLALPQSRLTSVEVMDFLEVPAIARRFGLDEEDLNKLYAWINETGIRWEYDGDEKQSRWQLPPEELNTWQFGLERLLLGYAMDDDSGLFADRMPYPVDANEAELLGLLCRFIELINETRCWISRPHSADDWVIQLNRLLNDFFMPLDSETLEVTQLQTVLEQLARDARVSDYGLPFSAQLIHYWLQQQLTIGHQVPSFINGGITFATLVPMRSIPFKVVCLLGMNDSDFPREEHPVSFDLMTSDGARKGDRSKRTDDRYLFLEALLSASEVLYISYEGRGGRDNQHRPPSTVVSELIGYLTGLYSNFSVLEHPLQPFSSRYYDGTFPSYQSTWYSALSGDAAKPPFLDNPLRHDEDLKAESMDQLTAFLRHPGRYYLQYCLGVYFEDQGVELKDSESFVLDGLERYQLTDLALTAIQSGLDDETWRKEMIATGRVLNNSLGYSYLEQQAAIAQNIINELSKVISGEPRTIRDTLVVNGRSLSFQVHNLFDDQHVDVRPGQLRKRQLVEIWIRHLFLNAAGHQQRTMTLSRGNNRADISVIEPLEASVAMSTLSHLVSLHDIGIGTPVPFLPECSFVFAETLARGKTPEDARQQVSKIWQQTVPWAESQDSYWRRLNSEMALFDDAFEQCAVEVVGPLLEYWSEL